MLPHHSLVPDLRSAAALAPIGYYRLITEGRILPHHAELLGFSPEAVQLGDNSESTLSPRAPVQSARGINSISTSC